MLQITYQKGNGSIIHRYRNTLPPYKIGDITSMGWKLLNVEYEYENKYYTKNEFNMIIQKNKQDFIKKRESSKKLKNEIKRFMYCFVSLVIIECIKKLLGI